MGGVLDLSRFKHVLSLRLGVSRSSISALVIGEHGENMLPLARFTSIGGVPLTSLLDARGDRGDDPEHPTGGHRRHREEGRDGRRTRKRDRADGEGGRLGQARRSCPPRPSSSGEYGVSGLGIGVPLMLGAKGVEKVFELELNDGEKAQFMKGVETIKEGVAALPPF